MVEEQIYQVVDSGFEEGLRPLQDRLEQLEQEYERKKAPPVSTQSGTKKPRSELNKKERDHFEKQQKIIKEDINEWKSQLLKNVEQWITKQPEEAPPTPVTPVEPVKDSDEVKQNNRIAKLKKQQNAEIPQVLCKPQPFEVKTNSFVRSQFAKRTLILNDFSGGKLNRKKTSKVKNMLTSRVAKKSK